MSKKSRMRAYYEAARNYLRTEGPDALKDALLEEVTEAQRRGVPYGSVLPVLSLLEGEGLRDFAKILVLPEDLTKQIFTNLRDVVLSDRWKGFDLLVQRSSYDQLSPRQRTELSHMSAELVWSALKDFVTCVEDYEKFLPFIVFLAYSIGEDVGLMISVMDLARIREHGTVPNIFVLSESLCEKLLVTDLTGLVCADVRLPLSGFVLSLPSGILANDRSLHVTELSVAEHQRLWTGPESLFTPPGRYVSLAFRAFDANNLHILRGGLNLSDDAAPLENSIRDAVIRYRYKDTAWTLYGQPVKSIEKLLMNFVANFSIYLQTEKATLIHRHASEIERLRGGRKLKNLRKSTQERIARLHDDKIFDVGTEVVISPELREAIRQGSGAKLTYRVLVRGHWRNQAHGPGLSLRKLMWIEPHVRGAGLPTPVAGHTYVMGKE